MSQETSAPAALSRFRRWLAIAVALMALGYLAYAVWTGFEEAGAELFKFNWLLYPPILALTLVNYGLRFFKWHYLLRRLDIDIDWRANAWFFTTGLAMVISPGKAGELVKPWLVKEATGTNISRTVPALVTERATDGLAVVFLAAVGVSTFASDQAWLIWSTIAGFIAVLLAASYAPFVMFCIGLLRNVAPSIADRLEEAYASTRVCIAPWPLFVTMSASMVAWFAECVGYWLTFKGLGVAAGLDVSTFVYAFATVFGAPSPGGMGMADVALIEMARAQISTLSHGGALAAGLLIRVATLWFGVLLGAFALLRIESVLAWAKGTQASTR